MFKNSLKKVVKKCFGVAATLSVLGSSMANFSAEARGMGFRVICTSGQCIEVRVQEQYQVFIRLSGQASYRQVCNLHSSQINGEINMNNLDDLRLIECMRRNLDQGGLVDSIPLDDGSEIIIRTKNGHVNVIEL